MILTWQELYNTDNMEDMRDMIAPINRLIIKLEDAKTHYIETEGVSSIKITKIIEAQIFWNGVLKMVTHQRKDI